MAGRKEKLRLFVGIYPPQETVRAVVRKLDSPNLPPFRPTPIEQIHLTLQFIGDTPAKELEHTQESVARSVAVLQKFSLTIQRLITLPERGWARLVAAETDSPGTLLEIQSRLAMRLARKPREKPGRKFRPHLTLCRFRSPTRACSIDEQVSLPEFDVTEIVLMRSTLTPNGAIHERIGTYSLS